MDNSHFTSIAEYDVATRYINVTFGTHFCEGILATKQQFTDLLCEIEPSKSTVDACSAAHTRVRNILRDDEEFGEFHEGTFLSGSYKRDTAIRPRRIGDALQRPDVDVIVITNHTVNDDPAEVIEMLHAALKRAGYTNLTVNRRSVNISMTTVEMDIVPIIDVGNDKYKIPDNALGEWLDTNPPAHTSWCTEVNKAAGGRFKPLVKLLKWWKRENFPELRRPKGFILETLVAKHMSYTETSYEELFLKLLRGIKSSYGLSVLIGAVPFIEDPGVPGNNVLSAVKFEEFKTFYDYVCKHIGLIEDAQAEQDEAEALKKWRKVFGSCFPATGGSRSTSNSLLREAANVAPVLLTFPTKAIAVPNKPKGFA